jgi:hypothetical protein
LVAVSAEPASLRFLLVCALATPIRNIGAQGLIFAILARAQTATREVDNADRVFHKCLPSLL